MVALFDALILQKMQKKDWRRRRGGKQANTANFMTGKSSERQWYVVAIVVVGCMQIMQIRWSYDDAWKYCWSVRIGAVGPVGGAKLEIVSR